MKPHVVNNIPKKIFIVPYRNRSEQKFFFCKYMSFLLTHEQNYEVYFSHQCDDRSFNRGATRNIGFLAVKEKYPEDYKQMTFIFNDLDTLPFNRIFDYDTVPNIVKHYYGFTHSLGGIVVIKGEDFEKINGYPNFWSWGLEDTCLQKRCVKEGIIIDRNHFYKIGSPQILQLFDGVERIINRKDPTRMKDDGGYIGLSTLHNIDYNIDIRSENDHDNLYDSLPANFFYINIFTFDCETKFEDDEYYKYDLREPVSNIMNPSSNKKTEDVRANPANWINIPYYPANTDDKKEYKEIPANVTMPSLPITLSKPLNNPPKPPPSSYKQLRQENRHMFPPKTVNTPGGASALNKINLRYRMAKM